MIDDVLVFVFLLSLFILPYYIPNASLHFTSPALILSTGPMTNAAGAQRVVIGVFEENLVELMAQTLVEVGTEIDR